MSRTNGRDLRIKNSLGSVLAVVNTKTINFNNTPVVVTGDDDDGFVTMLDRVGTRQMTCDVSGVTTDEFLRDKAVNGNSLNEQWTIEYLSSTGDGSVVYTIQGNFFLATFSETGGSDGSIEFTASLQSSGQYQKITA